MGSDLERAMTVKLFSWRRMPGWASALLLFWIPTAAAMLTDSVCMTWLGVKWPTGPDFFPNMFLGPPLALLQLASACVLSIWAIKSALKERAFLGIVAPLGAATFVAGITFVAYCLLALFYLTEVLQRTL